MEHIIFFMNVFKLSILLMPLIVIVIHKKKQRQELKTYLTQLERFIVILIVYSTTDMLAYYDTFITAVNETFITIVLYGYDLLYVVCIFLWLKTQNNISPTPAGPLLNRIGHYFLASYVTAWFLAVWFMDSTMYNKAIAPFYIGLLLFILLNMAKSLYYLRKESPDQRVYTLCTTFITAAIMVEYLQSYTNIPDIFYITYTLCWTTISILVTFLVVRKSSHAVQAESSSGEGFNINTAFEKAQIEYGLTERETTILREIFMGKSNVQIASDLFISESTVKSHIHNLLKKMDSDSRIEAIYKVVSRCYEDRSPH